MLCVVSFMTIACDSRTKEEKAFTYPTHSDETYGNGGLAVRKGDYLYFVNGYASYTSMKKKNAKYSVGSLLLAKLDANGNVVTEENGNIDDDYYISMSKKLCGYEATGLYVFGDYLYFTSPCQTDDSKTEKWAKERVDFYRIKLDKSSKVEKLYTTAVSNENLEFSIFESGNKVVIATYEKGESLNSKGGKDVLVTVVGKADPSKTQNVNDVVFTSDSVLFSVVEDGNYVVKRKDASGTSEFADFESSVSFEGCTEDYVFIKSSEELVRYDLETKESLIIFEDFGYDEIAVDPMGNIVLAVSENVVDCYRNGELIEGQYVEDSEGINIIGLVQGNLIYYTDEAEDANKIKSINYSDLIEGIDVAPTEIATISNLDTDHFDINEDYVYFFKTIGDNKYLHKLHVINNLDEVEVLVGVVKSSDLKVVE